LRHVLGVNEPLTRLRIRFILPQLVEHECVQGTPVDGGYEYVLPAFVLSDSGFVASMGILIPFSGRNEAALTPGQRRF
jgi:hypothetical protein